MELVVVEEAEDDRAVEVAADEATIAESPTRGGIETPMRDAATGTRCSSRSLPWSRTLTSTLRSPEPSAFVVTVVTAPSAIG